MSTDETCELNETHPETQRISLENRDVGYLIVGSLFPLRIGYIIDNSWWIDHKNLVCNSRWQTIANATLEELRSQSFAVFGPNALHTIFPFFYRIIALD